MLNTTIITRALKEALQMDFEVREETVNKPNESYEAFMVNKAGSMVGVCVRKDDLPQSDAQAVNEVVRIVREGMKASPNDISDLLMHYEQVEPMLRIRPVRIKGNEEYLRDKMYYIVHDIALVVCMRLGEFAVANLPKDVADEYWHKSEEEVLQQAADNTIGTVFTNTLEAEAFRMFDENSCRIRGFYGIAKDEPSVITNKSGHLAGGIAFLPKGLEAIADIIGNSFFIIPSSVHESLIIPEEIAEPSTLLQMVTNINAGEVTEEDRLTDNVYHYEYRSKTLSALVN